MQALARRLLDLANHDEVAFLISESNLYYAASSSAEKIHLPYSAITQLIQGIYATEPQSARRILRNRIYTTGVATEMCRGMIKVAAKRFTDDCLHAETPVQKTTDSKFIIPDVATEISNEIKITSFASGLTQALEYEKVQSLIDCVGRDIQKEMLNSKRYLKGNACASGMRLAFALIDAAKTEPAQPDLPRYLADRSVAAILISSEGELLDWALNTNSVNKTLHAEVNLVQSYFRKNQKPLPDGAMIITTLKPCKMCAGMIWQSAADHSKLKVFYGEDDLGPMATHTVLEEHGCLFHHNPNH